MASRLNRPAGGSHLIVHRSIDYCNAQLVLHFLIGKFVLPSPHTPESVESMSVFWATTRHRARHAGGGSSRNCQPAMIGEEIGRIAIGRRGGFVQATSTGHCGR